MDAGATQVGIFSKQVWVLSGERHHVDTYVAQDELAGCLGIGKRGPP